MILFLQSYGANNSFKVAPVRLMKCALIRHGLVLAKISHIAIQNDSSFDTFDNLFFIVS